MYFYIFRSPKKTKIHSSFISNSHHHVIGELLNLYRGNNHFYYQQWDSRLERVKLRESSVNVMKLINIFFNYIYEVLQMKFKSNKICTVYLSKVINSPLKEFPNSTQGFLWQQYRNIFKQFVLFRGTDPLISIVTKISAL